jgi:5'-nucleotidase
MKVIALLFSLLITVSASGQKLVILHTNDTHSQIETVRSGDFSGNGGVLRRAVYIENVKKENDNVLLLDAGDFNQGTPYYTVNHGDMEIDLMNAMGYEVVCLGNHEFDNGQEDLARRLSKARFQTVCANYDFSNTPLAPYVKPYTIVNKCGKKIGIFGLLANLKTYVSKSSQNGLVYRDAIEVANEVARKLKIEEKCDIVIALTHIGYSRSGKGVSDIRLAEESENIDMIIGGHSHTNLKEAKIYKNKNGKEIPVMQAAEKGIYVGRLDITF